MSEFKNVSAKRSKIMRAIKGKNTKIELLMYKILTDRGYGFFRRHVKGMSGTPDVVFEDHRVVVFLDSDYWHGRNFSPSKCRIKNNREAWIRKFVNNIRRDRRNYDSLARSGWIVLRYWESDIKKRIVDIVDEIAEALSSTANGFPVETKLSRT